MAIENHAILNGQIEALKIRKQAETNEPVYATLSLKVLRRTNAPLGNKKHQLRFDVVPVLVRDKEQLHYLIDNSVTKGDLLEISGVFNTKTGMKKYYCAECKKENFYDGSVAYITPLCMELKFLHPKQVELLCVTDEEARAAGDNTAKMMREKKTLSGEIIQSDIVSHENGVYTLKVVSQETPTEKEVQDWMKKMSDISNRIYVMGNLCADPAYFVNESGGKTATYQLGINRKYYVREDDPDTRTDYPYVKSIGDQADNDRKALKKGSLVFVEGAIQCRDNFTVEKTCAYCGAVNRVNGSTLEIVPYAVEYLRDCYSEEDVEEPEFDPDELRAFLDNEPDDYGSETDDD